MTNNMEQEIHNALKVLREGGTILYPTDTIWGLGCDATNEKAVEKIFQIKKRSESKSVIVLVSDDAMLNRFVKDVPEMAWDLMDANNSEEDDEPTKPITIIYDTARGLAKNVLAEDGSIGIRMVTRERNDFCHRLIHKFGKPIVSTSANISGEPAPQDFSEISEEIKSKVDYVVRLNYDSGQKTASSIIKLKANGEFKIIRE
jgi:L-threonylcarbamoyladenylate synthase